jgi:hypothetical protein
MQARLPNALFLLQPTAPTSVDRILATQFWRPGPKVGMAAGPLAKVLPFVPRALSPKTARASAQVHGHGIGGPEQGPTRRF